jgi:hypothetical protein
MTPKKTFEEQIAGFLARKKPYPEIQSILRVSPKRIAQMSLEMKNSDEVLIPAKIDRRTKMTPAVIESVRSETVEDSLLESKKLARMLLSKMDIKASPQTINTTRKLIRFKFRHA